VQAEFSIGDGRLAGQIAMASWSRVIEKKPSRGVCGSD
jgi:hypothetical protein